MPERETGKQRSQRIQIDYFRRETGLDRLKRGCILAGLIGGGLYAIYVLVAGGSPHLSTGPVILAHASFENQCYKCHQNLSPIAADAARPNIDLLRLSKVDSIKHTETACRQCHQVGNHYRDLMHEESQLIDQNCSLCHSDHQGREFDLTFVANQNCVSCHDALSEVCKALPRVKPETVSFSQSGHVEFFTSSATEDPGVIKFDHHQHMMPGQVDKGRKGAFTIEMLEPTMREKYRKPGQDDTAKVTLDCSSCHEMAGSPESNISQIADSELGRHLNPISFDRHCSACHSINSPGRNEDTLALPHAAPWSEIDLLLRVKITALRATGKMRVENDDSQTTPQPGSGTGKSPGAATLATDAEVATARSLVETGCLQCHDTDSIGEDSIIAARNGTAMPMIPGRWLKHGIYDHAAHREISCRYCHSQAYPDGDKSPDPPNDHQIRMIDGIDRCTGCHRDAETTVPDDLDQTWFGGQPTWASDNCTLCHRYHTLPPMTSSNWTASLLRSYARQSVENADDPPSGEGSYVESAKHGISISKWRSPTKESTEGGQ